MALFSLVFTVAADEHLEQLERDRGRAKRLKPFERLLPVSRPIHAIPGSERRYRTELREQEEALKLLRQESRGHTVTLVYGARDEEHNEAVVLKAVLESRK